MTHPRVLPAFVLIVLGLVGSATSARAETQLDQLLNAENAAKQVTPVAVIDDLAFLRRLSIDMIGRIPTLQEIKEFEAWPVATRREMLVDKLLKHPGFADRWTVFYADLFRIRERRRRLGRTGLRS